MGVSLKTPLRLEKGKKSSYLLGTDCKNYTETIEKHEKLLFDNDEPGLKTDIEKALNKAFATDGFVFTASERICKELKKE
jgi:hypothetical protein